MSRSLYKPLVYNNYYNFVINLKKRDKNYTKRLEKTLLERSKMTRGERKSLKPIRLKFCPRNILISNCMVGFFAKIRRGKGYINIKFIEEMVGVRVGSLTFNRVRSPIKISEKNIMEIGEPIKGKKHLDMKQPDRPKMKKQKKKRKK